MRAILMACVMALAACGDNEPAADDDDVSEIADAEPRIDAAIDAAPNACPDPTWNRLKSCVHVCTDTGETTTQICAGADRNVCISECLHDVGPELAIAWCP